MSWFAKDTLDTLFNLYAQNFGAAVKETARDIDLDTGMIRFRLFGGNERKWKAWDEAYPEHKGTRIYFSCVSTKPVEIWGDLREVAEGEYAGALVINPVSLGHELTHALRIIMSGWTLRNENDGDLLSPDKYAEVK